MQIGINAYEHLFGEQRMHFNRGHESGADLGGGCRGCAPPLPEMTCGFLIQLLFCKKKTMWFIGVEVEQETSAPPPKKNPGSAPVNCNYLVNSYHKELKSILTAFGLKQLIKDPTRVTQDSRSLTSSTPTNRGIFIL